MPRARRGGERKKTVVLNYLYIMKTVIITGASRGIGLATTKKFLDSGWRVIGTYKKNPVPLNSLDLDAVQLDLNSHQSIKDAVDTIKKLSPLIDVLINNAGVSLDPFEPAPSLEILRDTFEVNIFGLFDFTESLISTIKDGGSIVNITSRYGAFSFSIDPDDCAAAYRMSKAALNMYTRTLAVRLKERNVVVSAVHPGWVKTDTGNSGATETEKPNREPEEAAGDIYNLATQGVESGFFWQFGKKHEW